MMRLKNLPGSPPRRQKRKEVSANDDELLSRLQDLNLRPAHYKYAALPSELKRHVEVDGLEPPALLVMSQLLFQLSYTSLTGPPGSAPGSRRPKRRVLLLHHEPIKDTAGTPFPRIFTPTQQRRGWRMTCFSALGFAGMAGLEPTTIRLTAERSCKLIYMPLTDPRGYDPRFAVLETAVFSVYTKGP